ncbi:MAG: type II secretion system F family protein, partial [Pseudomonadota bacterium]
MALTTDQLTTFSIALFAVALLIVAGLLVLRELQRARSGNTLGKAIRRASAASTDTGWQPARTKKRDADEAKSDAAQNASELPVHWLRTRMGQALVADEDKRLIEQAGFTSVRAQLVFLVMRVALAV